MCLCCDVYEYFNCVVGEERALMTHISSMILHSYSSCIAIDLKHSSPTTAGE